MRWAVVLLLPALASATKCNGTALAAFNNCTSVCAADCPARTAQLGCEIEMKFTSSTRGAFPAIPLQAVFAYENACDKASFCDKLLNMMVTSDTQECCKGSNCPDKVPNTCSLACAPKMLIVYAACESLWNSTDTMTDAEDRCYTAMVATAAKEVYKQLADSVDVPLALWTMTGVPFIFFLLLAFFGRNIATLFRAVTGFLATALPLFIPAVMPFIDACGYSVGMAGMTTGCEDVPPFTAMTFVQIFMSVYVGVLGGWASKNNQVGVLASSRSLGSCQQQNFGNMMLLRDQNFGNMVQGFLVSYVIVIQTSYLWMPHVKDYMEFLQWLMLGLIVACGFVLGALNIVFPDLLNIMASSMIGIFMSMQIFCVIGVFSNWFFTFEVSTIAMVLGVAGCTDGECWAFLSGWIFLGLVGVWLQLRTNTVAGEKIFDKEYITRLDISLYRITHAFAMLMDLDEHMAEAAEYHSAEELVQIAADKARAYAQIATFLTDLMLLVFSVSSFTGIVEMLIYGNLGKHWAMKVLALVVLVNSVVVILLTFYHISIHRRPPDSVKGHEEQEKTERRKSFDRYLWGVMFMVPVTVTSAVLTLGCSIGSDPFGIFPIFNPTRGLEDSSDPDYDPEQRIGTQRFQLKIVAVALVGMVTTLGSSAFSVAKNLGGVFYLAVTVAKFLAFLLIVVALTSMGLGIHLVGEHKDDPNADLYLGMIALGAFMFLSAGFGVQAYRTVWDTGRWTEPPECILIGSTKTNYMRYHMLLWLTFLVNAGVFISAGLYIQDVDKRVDNDWAHINATQYLHIADPKEHLTKAEFIEQAKGGLRLVVITGVVIMGYLLLGMISSAFLFTRKESTMCQAGKLIDQHANAYLDSEEAAHKREQAGIEDYQTKLEKLEKNIKSSKNRKKSNMESEFDEPAGSDGDDDGGGGKADNPLDDDVRSDGE